MLGEEGGSPTSPSPSSSPSSPCPPSYSLTRLTSPAPRDANAPYDDILAVALYDDDVVVPGGGGGGLERAFCLGLKIENSFENAVRMGFGSLTTVVPGVDNNRRGSRLLRL